MQIAKCKVQIVSFEYIAFGPFCSPCALCSLHFTLCNLQFAIRILQFETRLPIYGGAFLVRFWALRVESGKTIRW
jgi:hypothetical protein